MSTSDTINSYYQRILQRDPTAGELNSWTTAVNAGSLSLQDVRSALIELPEVSQFVDPIVRLYNAAFGRVPDAAGLDAWVDAFRADQKNPNALESIAKQFLSSPEANNRFGGGEGINATFITALYQNVLGRLPDTEGFDFWLKSPASRADMLRAFSESAEHLARSEAPVNAFLDRAGAGTETYTGNLYSGVTGSGYALTSNTDVATSNLFVAGQVFTPGGDDRVNSLQDEDVLTGTGVNPTLNATVGNTNDNGSFTITPTLNGIETINAVFSNTDGTGLDLQDASGLKTVNVSRVAADARVVNMQGSVESLSVSNTSALADADLTYINGELDGDQTVTLTLSNANIDELAIGAQTTQTEQIENLKVVVAKASSVQELDMRSDGDATTKQSLAIEANANFILGRDFDGDGNVIEVNNGLVTPGGLGSITVTGAGNVTLGEVGAHKGFALDATATTGTLAVNITNAAGDVSASFKTGSGNATLLSQNDLAGDVLTGAGADSVTIQGSLRNVENPAGIDAAASVTTGAGDDTVVVNFDLENNTTVNTGEGKDAVTIGRNVDKAASAEDADATITLGAGEDTITFGVVTAGADLGNNVAGDIDGGADVDVMTITAEDSTNVTSSTLSVVSVETLNLVSRFATADNGVTGNLATDDDNGTADHTVDLARFDSALTAVSIDNQDRVTLVEDGFVFDNSGDDITVSLLNVAGEAISITSVETDLNGAGTGPIVDKLGAAFSADVTLEFTQEKNSVAVDTQTLSLVGENDFDVVIDDKSTDAVETLTLNVTGGGDHGIDLSNDFKTELTVTGGGTGELTIVNVEGSTVDTTAHLGNVYLDINTSEVKTIRTGGGADVVDLVSDVVGTTDALNLGAGTDRIIVANTLGDYTTANSAEDEVFEGFVSIEEIELRSSANLVMNEDAFATGVTKVLIADGSFSGIRLGTGFDRSLDVVIGESDAAGADIENDADVDLNVTVFAEDDENSALNFLDAGTGNKVAVTVLLDVEGAQEGDGISIASAGADLELDVVEGSIDSITVIDADFDGDGDGVFDDGVDAENRVFVTVDDAWSASTLTIDVSSLDDFDGKAATGGAVIDGLGEVDAKLVVVGSANSDTITGGDEADTLTGGAGSDRFDYSFANADDSTSQSTDVITDFATGDRIRVTVTLGAGGVEFKNEHAIVGNVGLGDNSLNSKVGDSYFATDSNILAIDVDGNGDIQDGADLLIDVANFTRAQLDFAITGGAGADLITSGVGSDTIDLSAGGADVVFIGNSDSKLQLSGADVIEGFVAADAALDLGAAGVLGAAGNYVELGDAAYANFEELLATANQSLATLAGTSAQTELYLFAFDTATADGYLFNDTNGDGSADQVIVLSGVSGTGFSEADLI